MARDITDTTPIETRDELVGWFEAGSKGAGPFLLGTEHEKFPYYLSDLAPVPYEGRAGGQGGIRALLEGMAAGGWERIEDAGALIGLFDTGRGGAISLEPGGQFELSGAPLPDVHETARELAEHLVQANEVARQHGIGFLGLGVRPPTPDWGSMIAEGSKVIFDQWWVAASPGAAILVLSLAFNLLADGLRDAGDPHRG